MGVPFCHKLLGYKPTSPKVSIKVFEIGDFWGLYLTADAEEPPHPLHPSGRLGQFTGPGRFGPQVLGWIPVYELGLLFGLLSAPCLWQGPISTVQA